jgi:hypothetical protein
MGLCTWDYAHVYWVYASTSLPHLHCFAYTRSTRFIVALHMHFTCTTLDPLPSRTQPPCTVVQQQAVSAAKVAAYTALEAAAGAMVAEEERQSHERQRRRKEEEGRAKEGEAAAAAVAVAAAAATEEEKGEGAQGSQSAKLAAEAGGQAAEGVLISHSQPALAKEKGPNGGPNGPHPALVRGKPSALSLAADFKGSEADELEALAAQVSTTTTAAATTTTTTATAIATTVPYSCTLALAAQIAPLTPNISNGRGYTGEERAVLEALAPPSPVALRLPFGKEDGNAVGEVGEAGEAARIDAAAPPAGSVVVVGGAGGASGSGDAGGSGVAGGESDDRWASLEHQAAAVRNDRLEGTLALRHAYAHLCQA